MRGIHITGWFLQATYLGICIAATISAPNSGRELNLAYTDPQAIQERSDNVEANYNRIGLEDRSVNTVQYNSHHSPQFYHLPQLQPHPQHLFERQHNLRNHRQPVHYQASDYEDYNYDYEEEEDDSSSFFSNPIRYAISLWDEAMDGTARIFDTSLPFAGYWWTIPVAGMLVYDILVPERIMIKRSIDDNMDATGFSIRNVEALLHKATEILNTGHKAGVMDGRDAMPGLDTADSEQSHCLVQFSCCLLGEKLRIVMHNNAGKNIVQRYLEESSQDGRESSSKLLAAFAVGLQGNGCLQLHCI